MTIFAPLVTKIPNIEIGRTLKMREDLIDLRAKDNEKKINPLWKVWHICWMPDDRIIKNLLFGTMEGTEKKGGPNRE